MKKRNKKLYRTIVAVDRYDLLVDGRLFVSRHPNLILSGEAAIGVELLTLLDGAPAELVLFSLSAPNRTKLTVMKTVARRFPHLKLLYMQRSKALCPIGGGFAVPADSSVSTEGKGRYFPITRLV